MTVVAEPARGGLWHNRAYRYLWFGQAVSAIGDNVFGTAIVLWIGTEVAGGRPWAPLAVAGGLLAEMLPVALFGLVGGVYADRWDRRRIVLATDAIRFALVAALAAVALAGTALPVGARLAVVYCAVALAGIAAQFFNPARFGLLAEVVPDRDRVRMGGIAQATSSFAALAGPALAAVLLATAGVPWSLLVTAAAFAISYAAVAQVPAVRARPPGAAPLRAAARGAEEGLAEGAEEGRGAPLSLRRDFTTGLRFFAADPVLRVVLATSVVVMIGVNAIVALDVFFLTANLHAAPHLYGVLGAALAAGSIIGAVLAATVGPRLSPTRGYGYCLVLAGLGMIAYSRTTGLTAAATVLLLTGVPNGVVSSLIGPLVLRAAPPQLVGRVIAVFQPAHQVTGLLSVTVAAWLASTVLRDLDATVLGVHLGTIDAVFLAAGLLITGSGVWAALALRHRRLGGTPAS
jgi:MFS family permease